MSWNGCQLILHPPAGAISGTGSVDIGAAGCGPIAFTSGGCEWTIPGQSGIPATYANSGSGTGRKISVAVNTSQLNYTTIGSLCGGGKGSHSNGAWSAKFILEGSDLAGTKPVGIRVAQLPVGFYTSGTSFAAEQYPATLTGQISKEHKFTPTSGGTSIQCQSGTFSSSLTGSGSALDVNANYASCVPFASEPVTVKMNSCRYVFNVTAGGPPATGTAQIACTTGGDAIELEIGTACKYRLPVQTLGTATYSTLGSLNARQVRVEVTGSGLTIERTLKNKLFCVAGGNAGTFSGGFTLGGVES